MSVLSYVITLLYIGVFLMDILIPTFINDNYTEEMATELLKAFVLFEEYELEEYELQYIDMLMSQSYLEPGTTASRFIEITKDKLKYILNLQGIKVNDEIKITDLNKIADALYLLQNSKDLYFIEDAIYSDLNTPMETICEIIVNLTNVSKSTLYECITEVDPNTIDKIKELLSILDEKQPTVLQKDHVTIYDVFERVVDERLTVDSGDLLGRRIIDSGFTLGLSFDAYMGIVGELDNDADLFSINIFSIYVLSEDFENGNNENLLSYIENNAPKEIKEEVIGNVIQLQGLLERS